MADMDSLFAEQVPTMTQKLREAVANKDVPGWLLTRAALLHERCEDRVLTRDETAVVQAFKAARDAAERMFAQRVWGEE